MIWYDLTMFFLQRFKRTIWDYLSLLSCLLSPAAYFAGQVQVRCVSNKHDFGQTSSKHNDLIWFDSSLHLFVLGPTGQIPAVYLDLPRVLFLPFGETAQISVVCRQKRRFISKVPFRCFYRGYQTSSWQKSPFGREKSPFQNLDIPSKTWQCKKCFSTK